MRFRFLVQAFQLRKFLLSYRSEIYNYTEDGRSFMTIWLRFLLNHREVTERHC